VNITTSYSSNVTAFRSNVSSPTTLAAEPAATEPKESFEPAEKTGTPVAVKVGKWGLAAATTTGAAALGWYAGASFGAGAGVAGAVVGGAAGALVLGGVGMFADIAAGFGSSSNKAVPFAIAGGVLGGVAGAAASALASGSVSGTVLAIAGGATAFIATGAATNILAK
jgi:hypothetical protein